MLVQPQAADDVAAALADVAVSAPVNGIAELAGPEAFRFDELARRVLSAKNDPRRVTADVDARYFGASSTSTPSPPATTHASPRPCFEDWLSQSTAGQTNIATRRS